MVLFRAFILQTNTATEIFAETTALFYYNFQNSKFDLINIADGAIFYVFFVCFGSKERVFIALIISGCHSFSLLTYFL